MSKTYKSQKKREFTRNETHSELYKTRQIYRQSLPELELPLSYNDWLDLPDSQKSAALFINFYTAICKGVNCSYNFKKYKETEIVSAIQMNLVKLVDYLKIDCYKYNEPFMFTMAKRVANHVSNSMEKYYLGILEDLPLTPMENNGNYVFFECVDKSRYNDIQSKILIESSDLLYDILSERKDLRVVVRYLTGSLSRIQPKYRNRMPELLKELRTLLKDYSEVFDIYVDCNTFEDVMNNEDLIDSAVVIMPDGTKTVYKHRKINSKQRQNVKFIFSGPQCEYIIPKSQAYNLIVESVKTK